MSNVEEKTDFKKSTPVLGIDSKTKEIEKFSDPLPDCKGNSVEERLLIPGPPLFPLFRRFWLQSIRTRRTEEVGRGISVYQEKGDIRSK